MFRFFPSSRAIRVEDFCDKRLFLTTPLPDSSLRRKPGKMVGESSAPHSAAHCQGSHHRSSDPPRRKLVGEEGAAEWAATVGPAAESGLGFGLVAGLRNDAGEDSEADEEGEAAVVAVESGQRRLRRSQD